MRTAAVLVLMVTTFSAAGNGNNAPPMQADLVCLTDASLCDIALVRPDGSSWDPEGGAPDAVLVLESYASLEDYSSADTVRTAPAVDVSGAASWNTIDPLLIHEDGALVIRVLDTDSGGFELMDTFTIDTAELSDGINSFEAEGGTRISFRIHRLDE
jgi:hypothetical protein